MGRSNTISAGSKLLVSIEKDVAVQKKIYSKNKSIVEQQDLTKGGSFSKIQSANGVLKKNHSKLVALGGQAAELERKGANPKFRLTDKEYGQLKQLRKMILSIGKEAKDCLDSIAELEKRLGSDKKEILKMENAVSQFQSILKKEEKRMNSAKLLVLEWKDGVTGPTVKDLEKSLSILVSGMSSVMKAQKIAQGTLKARLQVQKEVQKSIDKKAKETNVQARAWAESTTIFIKLSKSMIQKKRSVSEVRVAHGAMVLETNKLAQRLNDIHDTWGNLPG